MGITLALLANGPGANRGCQAIEVGTLAALAATGQVREVRIAPFSSEAVTVPEAEYGGMRVRRFAGRHPAGEFGSAWLTRRARGLGRMSGARISDYRYSFRWLDAVLRGCDGALLLGGDNFTLDYGRPEAFWALADYLHDRGVPTYLWGASVGPFNDSSEYEAACATRLSRLEGVLAREDLTMSYLSSVGVFRNVTRVSDPAFLMEPVRPSGRIGEVEYVGSVGLNLSPMVGTYRGGSNEWLAVAAEAVCQIVRGTGRPLLLVPHVTIARSNDYAFLEEVRRRAGAPGVGLLPAGLTAPELKHVIGQLDAFAGARTHSTIAAMSMGVPTISVGYSPKAAGVNNDVYGHTEFVIDVREFKPEILVELLTRALREHGELQTTLRDALPRLQMAAMLGAETVVSDLRIRSTQPPIRRL